MPMSAITKRSNFTMLTLKSIQTGMTKLPKERNLRDQAEQRMLKSQLKEIERNLQKINETEDLSYSNILDQSNSSDKNDEQPF